MLKQRTEINANRAQRYARADSALRNWAQTQGIEANWEIRSVYDNTKVWRFGKWVTTAVGLKFTTTGSRALKNCKLIGAIRKSGHSPWIIVPEEIRELFLYHPEESWSSIDPAVEESFNSTLQKWLDQHPDWKVQITWGHDWKYVEIAFAYNPPDKRRTVAVNDELTTVKNWKEAETKLVKQLVSELASIHELMSKRITTDSPLLTYLFRIYVPE